MKTPNTVETVKRAPDKRAGTLIDDMRHAIKGEIISRLGSMDEAERWAAMYRNNGADKALLALIDVLKA